MEVTSNNISNMATTGFKRSTAIISPFQEMLLYNMGNQTGLQAANTIGPLNQGSQVSEVVTDFSPGLLVKTEKTGDLAIAGEGFFRLEDPDGNYFYTRGGNFYVDPNGYLVHSSGIPLSGDNGPVNVTAEEFTVSREGEVISDGNLIDRLFIGGFEDQSTLQQNTNGLLTAPGEAEVLRVEEPEVRQGYKEQSNIDPAVEMVNAMEVLRAYSAGSKMAQAHDKLQDLLVREVGRIK